MDFKVAGDRGGVTAFQLDIKTEGLSIDLMATALRQAKEARVHILDQMKAASPEAYPSCADSSIATPAAPPPPAPPTAWRE